MKPKARMKDDGLWQRASDWVRLAAKTLWRKFADAGKRSQPFPKEAPH